MAVSQSSTVGGVVRAVWDDDTQTYTEYAADGTTVTLSRAYTAVENEQRTERQRRAATTTNSEGERTKIRTALPKIRTAIGEVDTLAANTSGNTRILATHLATSLRANLALGKIIAGVLDTAD